jgi:acetyl esterase/lipase
MLRDRLSLHSIRYITVCVSYRGYWTSRGRPSETGIAEDASAALRWVSSQQARSTAHCVPVVLWGQSIGAGVATALAAREEVFPNIEVKRMILETPFTNIRGMLEEIYPQKWLPYRYLWPFLWNHLDSYAALEKLSKRKNTSMVPDVVILEAGKDELVPKAHGSALEKRCVDLGLSVHRHVIGGALHTEVMSRSEGRIITADAIGSIFAAKK